MMIGSQGCIGSQGREMFSRVPPPEEPPRRGGTIRSAVRQAISYLRAEASRVLRPMRSAEVEARLAACRSCPRLVPAPPGTDRVGWCGACGCGKRGRAELTIKATMRDATCPLGAWK